VVRELPHHVGEDGLVADEGREAVAVDGPDARLRPRREAEVPGPPTQLRHTQPPVSRRHVATLEPAQKAHSRAADPQAR